MNLEIESLSKEAMIGFLKRVVNKFEFNPDTQILYYECGEGFLITLAWDFINKGSLKVSIVQTAINEYLDKYKIKCEIKRKERSDSVLLSFYRKLDNTP